MRRDGVGSAKGSRRRQVYCPDFRAHFRPFPVVLVRLNAHLPCSSALFAVSVPAECGASSLGNLRYLYQRAHGGACPRRPPHRRTKKGRSRMPYSAAAIERRRCTATRRDGAPCRAWALWSDPGQRCLAHAGQSPHGPRLLRSTTLQRALDSSLDPSPSRSAWSPRVRCAGVLPMPGLTGLGAGSICGPIHPIHPSRPPHSRRGNTASPAAGDGADEA
jgi:hypothetical protein